MANIPGLQPDIKFCAICKGELYNVSRKEMKSREARKSEQEFTHTYECFSM